MRIDSIRGHVIVYFVILKAKDECNLVLCKLFVSQGASERESESV